MFSFDFLKTLKQIKIRVLVLKLLLKTLLKTLEKVRKIALKNLLRNKIHFYRGSKNIAVGVQNRSKLTCRSTGQRSDCLTSGLSVDRPKAICLSVDCPIDRGQNQKVNSLVGRPAGRPGPDPESRLSGTVNCQVVGQGSVHVLYTSVDPQWSQGGF